MSTLLEKSQLAKDPDLRTKVQMAAIKAALAIKSAPERSSEWKYCDYILQEPYSTYWVEQLTMSAVMVSNLTLESPDIDVENAVNGIFPNFAIPFGEIH